MFLFSGTLLTKISNGKLNKDPWGTIIKSFLLDIFAAIFVNYLFIKNHTIPNLFYFYTTALPTWIVISYIFGRYEIDKTILKINLFNQLYKSLITGITFFSINVS